ncbi:uncharacterized protein LOC128401801 isoform X2 [Podarcis raffonei]|uniref:uncharacterized protein LOC128401801 isoform X2 n=1 Tax=Podarcis raffonei TaxID=65483 RepID=UPI0023295891|nr:uncharacterized protein LOC128401801 isoform X2 [Podarcis raffonei]
MGLSESRGLGPGEAPSERQVDEEDEAVAADPLLHMEARKGHCDTARQLLAQDPEALNSQDASGRTPLFWATEYRHERLVELLLAHGADPAVPDHEGNLCLHWAVYVGSPSIARMLLDAGSDVDALNGQGDSPLHLAAQERRYECLVLLLAHGAKVSLKNRAGQVALQCCKPSSPFWRALEAASARPPQPTERLLCRDISRGFEQVPIPCVNGVDEEPAPGAFLYVTQNFVSDSAVLPATGWGRSQHCECASSCSAPTCPCVERSLRSWYTPVRAAPALPGVRRGGQPEPLRASRPFLSSCGPGWPAGARRGQQHSRGGPHLRVPHALLLRQLLPQPGGAEGPQDAAAAVPGARQGLGSAHDAGGAPRSLPLPVLWGADFQRRGRPARGRRLFLCGGHAGGPRVLPGRALLRQRGPLPEPFVPAQPGGSAGGRGARDPRHRLLQRPGHPGGRRAGVGGAAGEKGGCRGVKGPPPPCLPPELATSQEGGRGFSDFSLRFDYGERFWEAKGCRWACLCKSPGCRYRPSREGPTADAAAAAAGDPGLGTSTSYPLRGFSRKSARSSPLKTAPRRSARPRRRPLR